MDQRDLNFSYLHKKYIENSFHFIEFSKFLTIPKLRIRGQGHPEKTGPRSSLGLSC